MASRIMLMAAMAIGVLALAIPAVASKVGTGTLFLNGQKVGTVVPPAATPNEGTDPFFVVTNGVEGQLGIAGVGPGEPGYHGGHWAVYLVTFKKGVTPYLLTS